MSKQAHAYLSNAPALLNDSRRFIDTISANNRNAFYSVTASISALEAFLNELIEIGEGYKSHGLSNCLVRMSASIKIAEEQRLSVPIKFLCAYKGLLGTDLHKGSCKPYQRLIVAIFVRNHLIHPKASRLSLNSDSIELMNEGKLLKTLASNGFKIDSKVGYDWHSIVGTKDFAIWVYQSVLDCINLIFDSWPHSHAIETYKEIYSSNLYSPSQWQ